MVLYENAGTIYMRKKLILLLAVSMTLTAFVSASPLKLAPVFMDHMVLQRGQPLLIWGTGAPGETVHCTFGPLQAQAIVGADEAWEIRLPAQPANESGATIFISSGSEQRRLDDILIGDVWLCLGQSNMEFPMKKEAHFVEESTQPSHPLLRFYNPSYAGKNIYARLFPDSVKKRLTPEDFYEGRWEICNTQSMPEMSAVGYYFGRRMSETVHVPVGLINLAIGGCPLETFINPEALKRDTLFAKKAQGDWLHNESLPVWVRERGLQNLGDAGASAHGYQPGFAWQAGIAPLTRMPVQGIIWYQGESNAQEIARVEEYPRLFKLMVDDMRKTWGRPHMPFYWVQLSSIDTAHYASKYWPAFRDGQRKSLEEISEGGMAVSSDKGAANDVHPTEKREIGYRLARWALSGVYGKRMLPSGPLVERAWYRSGEHGNGEVVIDFKYGDGLQTADAGPLRGFSVDGKKVGAEIRGDRVVIPVHNKPATVAYAWEPFTDANLVNRDSLPASTFQQVVDSSKDKAVTVFESGMDGYKTFRIPAIIKAPDGTLLAFCEGRVGGIGDFGHINIVLRRSADSGRTWSPIQVAAENGSLQAGNAAPVVDYLDPAWPGGRIFLFYNKGNAEESDVRNGKGHREVCYRTSTDNGLTWSEPVDITSQVSLSQEDWRSYANTPGHAVQLTKGSYKGRIYVAANHSQGAPKPGFADYKAHGFYTDDHGKTFHLGATVPIEGGNESMAVELSGGRLMMNSRNQHGHPRCRIVSVSSDGGSHWDSSGFDRSLPDPVNQGSILLTGWNKKQAVLAFCNTADTAFRDNLTLRISKDDGRHWTSTYVIDRSPTGRHHGYAAYSDLVLIDKQAIGVLYERDDYREIVFKECMIR